MARRLTITDVASAAGMSIATVSTMATSAKASRGQSRPTPRRACRRCDHRHADGGGRRRGRAGRRDRPARGVGGAAGHPAPDRARASARRRLEERPAPCASRACRRTTQAEVPAIRLHGTGLTPQQRRSHATWPAASGSNEWASKASTQTRHGASSTMTIAFDAIAWSAADRLLPISTAEGRLRDPQGRPSVRPGGAIDDRHAIRPGAFDAVAAAGRPGPGRVSRRGLLRSDSRCPASTGSTSAMQIQQCGSNAVPDGSARYVWSSIGEYNRSERIGSMNVTSCRVKRFR
jgi:hypothetical protein